MGLQRELRTQRRVSLRTWEFWSQPACYSSREVRKEHHAVGMGGGPSIPPHRGQMLDPCLKLLWLLEKSSETCWHKPKPSHRGRRAHLPPILPSSVRTASRAGKRQMVSWVGSLRDVGVVVALEKGEEAQSLSEGGDWRMTGMGGALGC